MPKAVIKGVNDLYTWCLNNGEYGQQLIDEWVGEDENGYRIDMDCISMGSHKKVKWKCSNGHKWFADLCHRTSNRRCCPYCSGIKVSKDNCLLEWCKNNSEFGQRLIDEWVGLDENGIKVDMDSVSRGSHKRVKWRCNKGHEWCIEINSRTRNKTGCPYCFEEKRGEIHRKSSLKKGENDLETWCLSNGTRGQQLIREWAGLDENNQPISLDGISRGSRNKVKWRCSKGHEWYATVNNRTRCKSDCPYCFGTNKILKERSLQAWCRNNGEFGQQITDEWVGLDKNSQPISMDSISKSSNKKVKWRCNKGHEWYATVNSRTYHKSGCNQCNVSGTSYPEQYLYNALKQIYKDTINRCRVLQSPQHPQGIEFDIGIPNIPLCIEYSSTYWHDGREEMDEYKKQLCKEHGVRLIQIVDDSYDELEFKMDEDYICFRMNQSKRTEILQAILEHILKMLNHTLDEIDLVKVEKDTLDSISGTIE